MSQSITLGRSGQCDIILPPDDRLSRVHARISIVGGQYVYEDLGRNGSYVNGQALHGQRIAVAPGTPIMLAGRVPLPWDQVYQRLPLSGSRPYQQETRIDAAPVPAAPAYRSQESINIGWGILAFLIPLAGWIMYFVWRDETPKRASQAATLAWIGFGLNLLMVCLQPTVFYVF